MENKYLEQVVAQQADVQRRLMKSSPAPQRAAAPPMARARVENVEDGGAAVATPAANAVDVKVTGFWRWRTVIVPPNAYVVHTRRGRTKPLTLGMGTSFRYNPYIDAYLVVPATTQTILISANCICRERQGILVQGYVQWIIANFEKAYTKLDFSDPTDPMAVVNTQLREQAEATVKDTVATMSIDEVLSDKQPIIKELTRRLREVSEGGGDQEGLGLRIVTVQIKEAVVSSTRLWESLQKPFRAERSKDARLAELENEALVKAREAQGVRETEELAIQTAAAVAERRAQAEAAAFDREQKERTRRAQLEAKQLAEALAFERERHQSQAELDELRLRTAAAHDDFRSQERVKLAERDIGLDAKRQKVANDVSDEQLRLRVIQALPDILAKTPTPKELRVVSINGDAHLAGLVGGITALVDRLGRAPEGADS